VVTPYRRFGKTYRSHKCQEFLYLKIGPIGCTETSARNYHYTLRNRPEERCSHPLCVERLKSRTIE